MKYKTIYADPPWPQKNTAKHVGCASDHYTIMSFDRIKLMGDWIDQISEDNSHLYMWTVSNFLQEALDTMRAWGYRYVTNLAWVKNSKGQGWYFKTQHEILLFGVKGSLDPKKKGTYSSIIEADRRKHSQKPDEFYSHIENVSPGPYLELFARSKREGWHSWGNELITSDGRSGETACDVSEDFGFWQPPLQKAS